VAVVVHIRTVVVLVLVDELQNFVQNSYCTFAINRIWYGCSTRCLVVGGPACCWMMHHVRESDVFRKGEDVRVGTRNVLFVHDVLVCLMESVILPGGGMIL
jgi:hypothetical protein